jgi:two-component system cell cycle response regulator
MNTAGWHVDHVSTGEEALEKVKGNNYDLVVSDLILAGKLSGINVIEMLRAGNSKERNLPVLALSGWNDMLRQVYVLQQGASDFIAKPFQNNDFLARALNLIHTKRKNDESNNLNKVLKHKAHTDNLTGLCNRHCVQEYSEQVCKDAQLNGISLALLMIDADQFKNINDSYGHEQGDKVLREIGSQIKLISRDTDIAGRWGGEEFLVILPNCNLKTASERAEDLRKSIEILKPSGIPVTLSIGVSALMTDRNDSFDELVKRADEALYQAKESGRNRVNEWKAQEKI